MEKTYGNRKLRAIIFTIVGLMAGVIMGAGYGFSISEGNVIRGPIAVLIDAIIGAIVGFLVGWYSYKGKGMTKNDR